MWKSRSRLRWTEGDFHPFMENGKSGWCLPQASRYLGTSLGKWCGVACEAQTSEVPARSPVTQRQRGLSPVPCAPTLPSAGGSSGGSGQTSTATRSPEGGTSSPFAGIRKRQHGGIVGGRHNRGPLNVFSSQDGAFYGVPSHRGIETGTGSSSFLQRLVAHLVSLGKPGIGSPGGAAFPRRAGLWCLFIWSVRTSESSVSTRNHRSFGGPTREIFCICLLCFFAGSERCLIRVP